MVGAVLPQAHFHITKVRVRSNDERVLVSWNSYAFAKVTAIDVNRCFFVICERVYVRSVCAPTAVATALIASPMTICLHAFIVALG
jgi:hypothetical protein